MPFKVVGVITKAYSFTFLTGVYLADLEEEIHWFSQIHSRKKNQNEKIYNARLSLNKWKGVSLWSRFTKYKGIPINLACRYEKNPIL